MGWRRPAARPAGCRCRREVARNPETPGGRCCRSSWVKSWPAPMRLIELSGTLLHSGGAGAGPFQPLHRESLERLRWRHFRCLTGLGELGRMDHPPTLAPLRPPARGAPKARNPGTLSRDEQPPGQVKGDTRNGCDEAAPRLRVVGSHLPGGRLRSCLRPRVLSMRIRWRLALPYPNTSSSARRWPWFG
jgi:hypothetical protein